MNRVVQTVPPSEDGLDALLGSFFRAEMPSPWPAFRPPAARTLPFRPAVAPRKRRGYLVLSRVALAASVALLLLAALLMPRGPGGLSGPGSLKVSEGDAMQRHGGQPVPAVLPDIKNLPGIDGAKGPGNVKSSLQLEQKEGKGAIRIDVMELPSGK